MSGPESVPANEEINEPTLSTCRAVPASVDAVPEPPPPTPWPRHVLLRWLRYVDGCVLRGVRYHVPQHCCARVKEIAHTGKAPGRRLVQDVSGCGEDEARRLWGALKDTLADGGPKIAVLHLDNCFNMAVELLADGLIKLFPVLAGRRLDVFKS